MVNWTGTTTSYISPGPPARAERYYNLRRTSDVVVWADALLTKAQDYELPMQARGPLGSARAFFGLAALLALASNMPLPGYKNAERVTVPSDTGSYAYGYPG